MIKAIGKTFKLLHSILCLAAPVEVVVMLRYIWFCMRQLEASNKIAFTDPTGAFLISHWSTGFYNSLITLSSAALGPPLSHRFYLKLTLWLTRPMRPLFSPLRGHTTCRLPPQPFQLLWLLNLGTPDPPPPLLLSATFRSYSKWYQWLSLFNSFLQAENI